MTNSNYQIKRYKSAFTLLTAISVLLLTPLYANAQDSSNFFITVLVDLSPTVIGPGFQSTGGASASVSANNSIGQAELPYGNSLTISYSVAAHGRNANDTPPSASINASTGKNLTVSANSNVSPDIYAVVVTANCSWLDSKGSSHSASNSGFANLTIYNITGICTVAALQPYIYQSQSFEVTNGPGGGLGSAVQLNASATVLPAGVTVPTNQYEIGLLQNALTTNRSTVYGGQPSITWNSNIPAGTVGYYYSTVTFAYGVTTQQLDADPAEGTPVWCMYHNLAAVNTGWSGTDTPGTAAAFGASYTTDLYDVNHNVIGSVTLPLQSLSMSGTFYDWCGIQNMSTKTPAFNSATGWTLNLSWAVGGSTSLGTATVGGSSSTQVTTTPYANTTEQTGEMYAKINPVYGASVSVAK